MWNLIGGVALKPITQGVGTNEPPPAHLQSFQLSRRNCLVDCRSAQPAGLRCFDNRKRQPRRLCRYVLGHKCSWYVGPPGADLVGASWTPTAFSPMTKPCRVVDEAYPQPRHYLVRILLPSTKSVACATTGSIARGDALRSLRRPTDVIRARRSSCGLRSTSWIWLSRNKRPKCGTRRTANHARPRHMRRAETQDRAP